RRSGRRWDCSMPQMVVASRLRDGFVVFLGPGDEWVDSIDAGALSESPEEAERLLAVAKGYEARNVVVEPYLIEVAVADGQRRPAEVREAIRAFGPTVRTDLNQYD